LGAMLAAAIRDDPAGFGGGRSPRSPVGRRV